MGKSHGRERDEHCGHEAFSERTKAVIFCRWCFHSAFDRGAGVPSLKPEKDSRSIGA